MVFVRRPLLLAVLTLGVSAQTTTSAPSLDTASEYCNYTQLADAQGGGCEDRLQILWLANGTVYPGFAKPNGNDFVIPDTRDGCVTLCNEIAKCAGFNWDAPTHTCRLFSGWNSNTFAGQAGECWRVAGETHLNKCGPSVTRAPYPSDVTDPADPFCGFKQIDRGVSGCEGYFSIIQRGQFNPNNRPPYTSDHGANTSFTWDRTIEGCAKMCAERVNGRCDAFSIGQRYDETIPNQCVLLERDLMGDSTYTAGGDCWTRATPSSGSCWTGAYDRQYLNKAQEFCGYTRTEKLLACRSKKLETIAKFQSPTFTASMGGADVVWDLTQEHCAALCNRDDDCTGISLHIDEQTPICELGKPHMSTHRTSTTLGECWEVQEPSTKCYADASFGTTAAPTVATSTAESSSATTSSRGVRAAAAVAVLSAGLQAAVGSTN